MVAMYEFNDICILCWLASKQALQSLIPAFACDSTWKSASMAALLLHPLRLVWPDVVLNTLSSIISDTTHGNPAIVRTTYCTRGYSEGRAHQPIITAIDGHEKSGARKNNTRTDASHNCKSMFRSLIRSTRFFDQQLMQVAYWCEQKRNRVLGRMSVFPNVSPFGMSPLQ